MTNVYVELKIFCCLWLAGLIGAIWLRTTTVYDLKEDRLTISRSGWVWMEICFEDVDEILIQRAFVSRLRQIRLYRFPPLFFKMTRITKRNGFRYVLINPENPQFIIDALQRYRSQHPLEDLRTRYPGPELSFEGKAGHDEKRDRS